MQVGFEQLPPVLRHAIHEEMENQAVSAGTITREGMMRLLQDIGLADMAVRLARVDTGPGPSNGSVQAARASAGPALYDVLDGLTARLPPGFQFPSMTTLAAWHLWCCGDESKGYPPFRQVLPQDLPDQHSANARKRLSDFRFLMKALTDAAQASSVYYSKPTIVQANEMFEVALPRLGVLDGTERIAQLAFMTVVGKLRAVIKSRRAQA